MGILSGRGPLATLPLVGMGGEVFRWPFCCAGSQHKIEAHRHTQPIGISVFEHAVIQPRREQHQETRLRLQEPFGLVSRMVITNRATMANGETRHQFIEMARSMQTQGTVLSCALTAEIHHSTEVRVGVMVATDDLAPLAQHRPTTLEMHIQLVAIKTSALEIVPDPSHHLIG